MGTASYKVFPNTFLHLCRPSYKVRLVEEQPGVVEVVPTHGRDIGMGGALRFFSTQTNHPPIQAPEPQISNLAVTAYCGKADETPPPTPDTSAGGI